MKMNLCTRCSQVYFAENGSCVHCRRSGTSPLISVMFGLSLLGCGTTEKDTADSSVEIQNQPENVEPPYGVGAFDEDGDGFESLDDCDDGDPFSYPGAAYAESTEECMQDQDGDGYGAQQPTSAAISGNDCNDNDAQIHPQAQDTPGDGVDSNCDGVD